jgi:hypothetical protein
MVGPTVNVRSGCCDILADHGGPPRCETTGILLRDSGGRSRPAVVTLQCSKAILGLPAPFVQGFEGGEAVVQDEIPVDPVRMGTGLSLYAVSDGAKSALALLDPFPEGPHVADEVFGSCVTAQEDPEEELVSGTNGRGRLSEPALQCPAPALGDVVDVPVGAAFLPLHLLYHEVPVVEAAEHGVDVPVALGPKMTQPLLDLLLDVVAGAGPLGQKPQNRELGWVATSHGFPRSG